MVLAHGMTLAVSGAVLGVMLAFGDRDANADATSLGSTRTQSLAVLGGHYRAKRGQEFHGFDVGRIEAERTGDHCPSLIKLATDAQCARQKHQCLHVRREPRYRLSGVGDHPVWVSADVEECGGK